MSLSEVGWSDPEWSDIKMMYCINAVVSVYYVTLIIDKECKNQTNFKRSHGCFNI
jgi:hypothetical protein